MGEGTMPGWHESRLPVLKYALKFGAFMLLFYAASETPWSERFFWPNNLHANAWLANGILQVFHQNSHVTGNVIEAENYAFVVKRGCDATEPAFLLIAAIAAFPASYLQKLAGALMGTPLLLALNQLRIVALYFAGRDHPGLYPMLHLTLFPSVFIFLALLLWLGWLQWVTWQREGRICGEN